MNYRIEYTDRAEEDIFRNASWWAERHSLDQASEFLDVVRKQISTLADMPGRFGFAYENDKFEIEIRQMTVGLGPRPSYRAIYTIRDSEVVILAVRRGAQDEYG